MQVTSTPKYQSISVTYGTGGVRPTVNFHLRGDWYVKDIPGVEGTGAHGTYDFEMTRNPESVKFEKPRKLELKGIINEDIPEETRHALAKAIKEDLKDQMVRVLEDVNGSIKRAVHGIW